MPRKRAARYSACVVDHSPHSFLPGDSPVLLDRSLANALARAVMRNFLHGVAADGKTPLPSTVQVPQEQAVYLSMLHLLSDLILSLGPHFREKDLTTIGLKLFAHMASDGPITLASVRTYPVVALVNALRWNPDLIKGSEGFGTAMDMHNEHEFSAYTRAHPPCSSAGSVVHAARRVQRWPLLADGQDTDSIEAIVAYHLHRLQLTGQALTGVRHLSRPALQDLTQGRLPLTSNTVRSLATSLRLPHRELTRPLTPEETQAWSFYRSSARSPRHVWTAAQSLWRAAALTNRQAADVMGLPHYVPANALNPRRRPITLTYAPALRLTAALGIAEGPNWLLQGSSKTLSGSRNKPSATLD